GVGQGVRVGGAIVAGLHTVDDTVAADRRLTREAGPTHQRLAVVGHRAVFAHSAAVAHGPAAVHVGFGAIEHVVHAGGHHTHALVVHGRGAVGGLFADAVHRAAGTAATAAVDVGLCAIGRAVLTGGRLTAAPGAHAAHAIGGRRAGASIGARGAGGPTAVDASLVAVLGVVGARRVGGVLHHVHGVRLGGVGVLDIRVAGAGRTTTAEIQREQQHETSATHHGQTPGRET